MFLLFVNNLPEAIEALALVFVNDVKMVVRRVQKTFLRRSVITTWGWSEK